MTSDASKAIPDLSADALWSLLASQSRGVLATIKSDGRPQLSNVGYVYDPETRVVRIIAAGFRAKTRNLRRDPRVSMHVASPDFRLWGVAEGTAAVSPPAARLDDATGHELFDVFRARHPELGVEEATTRFAAAGMLDRLVIRFRVERVYGGNSSPALGVSAS